jgi:DNA-directed RNA polymerase subunit RPC12/RpoP
MGQVIAYKCDRCGSEISSERNHIQCMTGRLQVRFGKSGVDLCLPCARQFEDWLQEELPVQKQLGPVERIARREDGKGRSKT